MSAGTGLPELLLPAGGFEAGVAAFEGGADAVYLGFSSFSARRQARNFGHDEYRRLLRLARQGGRKVYVALNTVIRGDDSGELAPLLSFLEDFPPDAVIFQDWGLAAFMRRQLPAIPLHASTQTAIQTPEAARLAVEAGVERIVLPRETTINELSVFHKELPRLELEVFVHGALCYSFSGVCLASGLLLGRSGNRGECAQVCRSWYERGSGEEGYWFSCRDLELVDSLGALAAAGARSLKVEGRMKSPEYVYSVARLYRAALDRLGGGASGGESLEELKDRAHLAFGRSPTPGWSGLPKGERLVDPRFPGHRGVPLGKVVGAAQGKVTVELESPLGLRDGVLALVDEHGESRPLAAEAFSVQDLADARSGKPLVTARAGSRIEFASPRPLKTGQLLRRISARELDRRAVNPDSFEAALLSLPATLSIVRTERPGEGRLKLDLPGFPPVVDSEALPLAAAKVPGGFLRVKELFAESGEREFRVEVELDPACRLSLGDQEQGIEDLFIPPSLLKKAKNRLYETIASMVAMRRETRAASIIAALGLVGPSGPSVPPILPMAGRDGYPPRAALGFPHEALPSLLPFALPRFLRETSPLPEASGASWLPLAPLVADWPAYEAMVMARVAGELTAGKKLMVGIDGLHHAALARRLRGLHPDPERLGFFGDIHLYAATSRAAEAWAVHVPGLAFAYAWIEDSGQAQGNQQVSLPAGLEPPLFVSKACHLRHALSGGGCPDGCGRRFAEELRDRERHYVVLVEDCVTMLFRKGQRGQQ